MVLWSRSFTREKQHSSLLTRLDSIHQHRGWFVCLLVAERPSNTRVYLRDASAKTTLRAATLRQKLQTKLSISPSHSILTPGQPVPALTLYLQAPGRVATGVPILSHWYDSTPEKSRRKRDSNPGSSALVVDALTTRPTRRYRGCHEIDLFCENERLKQINKQTTRPLSLSSGFSGFPKEMYIILKCVRC